MEADRTRTKLETRERAVVAREYAAAEREREAEAAAASVEARGEELAHAVRAQSKVAVGLELKAANVSRREQAVAAREAELSALWESAETSALDRADVALAPRFAALEERERELARRELLLFRGEAGEPGGEPPAPVVPRPVARAQAASSAVAPPQRNLPILESLVTEHGRNFGARVDEWRAYLHYLREYADASGVLPPTFEPLVADAFAELLALDAATDGRTLTSARATAAAR
ncbi:MAG: hypothetical protein ABR583_03185 [Gaiellaceae bacterium]